jgi:hypothetical protein
LPFPGHQRLTSHVARIWSLASFTPPRWHGALSTLHWADHSIRYEQSDGTDGPRVPVPLHHGCRLAPHLTARGGAASELGGLDVEAAKLAVPRAAAAYNWLALPSRPMRRWRQQEVRTEQLLSSLNLAVTDQHPWCRTNHHAGESPSARAARVEKGGCSRIRDAATIVSSLTPITSPRTNTRSA